MEKSLVKFLKVKFLAVIFVFAALLASLSSCSGLSSVDAKKESGLKEKKTQLVKVQMSVEGINGSGSADNDPADKSSSVSRTINPSNMEAVDIIKVVLWAQEKTDTDDYQDYQFISGTTERVSCLEWTDKTVSGKTAFEAFTSSTVILEPGTYKFMAEFITPRTSTESNEHVTQIAETEPVEINLKTTKISLGTAHYADNGNLSITFEWLADGSDQSPIGKLEAGLFTYESRGTVPFNADEYDEDYDGYNVVTYYSDFDKTTHTFYGEYFEPEVPNGSYYIKFQVYADDNETVMNSFIDLVKIHGFKTEQKITFDLDKINWQGGAAINVSIPAGNYTDIEISDNFDEDFTGTQLEFTAPKLEGYYYDWYVDDAIQPKAQNQNVFEIDAIDWPTGVYEISVFITDENGEGYSALKQIQWKKKYAVFFEANRASGASGEAAVVPSQYFFEGGTEVVQNPSVQNPDMAPDFGWYLDADFMEPFDFEDNVVPSSSFTLYACWNLTSIYVSSTASSEGGAGSAGGNGTSGGDGTSGGSGNTSSGNGTYSKPFGSVSEALGVIKSQAARGECDSAGNELKNADYTIYISGYINEKVSILPDFNDSAKSVTLRGLTEDEYAYEPLDSIGGPFDEAGGVGVALNLATTVPFTIENLGIRNGNFGIIAGNYLDEAAGETKNVAVNLTLGKYAYIEKNMPNSGITMCDGDLKIDGAVIKNNNGTEGGGLVIRGGNVEMCSGKIEENLASGSSNGCGGGVYICGGTLTLNSGNDGVYSSVIQGNSAEEKGGGIYIGSSGTGESATYGKVIMNAGSVSFNGSDNDFEENSYSPDGAGVYVDSKGVFTMNGGKIWSNKCNVSGKNGAGIYIASGATVSITGEEDPAEGYDGRSTEGMQYWPVIADNMANQEIGDEYYVKGGAIYIEGGEAGSKTTLSLKNAVIDKNIADFGGGIYAASAGAQVEITMESSWIYRNEANKSDSTNQLGGGGVLLTGSGVKFTMKSGLISKNYALSYGGGVCLSSGAEFIMNGGKIGGSTGEFIDYDDGNFTNDSPTAYGGGVYVGSADFKMYNGEISYNRDAYYGGGVCVDGGSFVIYNGTIDHNKSTYYGGGVYISPTGEFNMHGGTISYNTTDYKGRGVYQAITDASAPAMACGVFKMGGSAFVENNNEVYLSGKLTIIEELKTDVSSEGPVATITPAVYPEGLEIGDTATDSILEIGDEEGLTGTELSAEYHKFAVSSQSVSGSDEINWTLSEDGKLKRAK